MTENAQSGEIKHRILMIGGTGTGKTSQLLTLSGRKFAYIFDPAGLSSLEGHDIDYATFFPLPGEVDMAPRSILRKGLQYSDSDGKIEPTLYNRWRVDINKRALDGFFDGYDIVAFDSLTMLSKAAYDRVLYLQRKVKREDERTDYRLAGEAITNAVQSITSIPCTIYCTVHDQKQKEEVARAPTIPGGSKTFIPRMFSDIFVTSIETTKEGAKYMMQTRPDRRQTLVKTSVKGLELFEDVTIDFGRSPEGQGIGGIL